MSPKRLRKLSSDSLDVLKDPVTIFFVQTLYRVGEKMLVIHEAPGETGLGTPTLLKKRVWLVLSVYIVPSSARQSDMLRLPGAAGRVKIFELDQTIND